MNRPSILWPKHSCFCSFKPPITFSLTSSMKCHVQKKYKTATNTCPQVALSTQLPHSHPLSPKDCIRKWPSHGFNPWFQPVSTCFNPGHPRPPQPGPAQPRPSPALPSALPAADCGGSPHGWSRDASAGHH